MRQFLLCLLTLNVLITQAQSPRTFYVGHSLSDQIPDMVQSLSDDHANLDFSWVYQSIPGAPLRWQYQRIYADDYPPTDPHYYAFYDPIGGLRAGDFDVLVLTEAVPRYLELIDETYAYADSFYQYATQYNPNIQIYLYEDWHCLDSGTPTGCDYDIDSNPWRQRLADDLAMWESVVDTLNNKYNPANPVCLIPAGQGLIALYDSIQAGVIPGINAIDDLFSDRIHLNDVGKYYIACIHFAMIHRTNPTGLTNVLQYWWGGDFENTPSVALAQKFQEMAWETVMNYPRTCLETVTNHIDISLDQDCLNIYPTANDSTFEIDGTLSDYTIQILDAMGGVHQTMSNSGNHLAIDMNSLPNGLYFIRFENIHNQNICVQKILKGN